jgi:beta-phosphoglucomutase
MPQPPRAVIFDLDGVLTDTADLHYRSWVTLAGELGILFDRCDYDALRGLSRERSLEIFLGPTAERYSPSQKAELAERKNRYYLALVDGLSPRDAFVGVPELLRELRQAGLRLAVASSSRNAGVVLERLGLVDAFDAIVDGNAAPRSKPDPQVFLVAAERLDVAPEYCVAVEDAESGVAAAIAAGMIVIGVGPVERVGAATRVVSATGQIDLALIQSLIQF